MSTAAVAFVFFGDWGSPGKGARKVASEVTAWCEAHPCDLVALLGDNFYFKGVSDTDDPLWRERFEDPYAGVDAPFYAALGNHDYEGNAEAQVEYSYKSRRWRMPAPYYSFSEGGVDFFVLDTEQWSAEQKSWFKAELKGSSARWRVVIGHRPIRSSGTHGNDSKLKCRILTLMRKYDVDFYLSGHDHDLEVIDDDPAMVVSGGGGAPPRDVKPQAGSLFAASTNGFGYLSIEGDRAHLSMVDERGKVLYERDYQAD